MKSVWPPAPIKPIEIPTRERPKKFNKDAIAAIGAVVVSFLALLTGLGAGIGHKDFSESLLDNVCNALFDLALWGMAILYWVTVMKTKWLALKQKPTRLRALIFYSSMVLLTGIYGISSSLSLWCLAARAAASDTIY